MFVMHSDTDVYDMVDILGKGTFGEVAKCWKRSTGQFVAIKILNSFTERSGYLKSELKILKILGTFNADKFYFIHLFEYFNDNDKLCLVFELLEQNLFEFQKDHNFAPIPVRHIRTISKQVLTALQKLKELSIAHTDIKPENIMLVNHSRYPFKVKLIDFGSASVLADIQHIKGPYIQSRFYRAPEILLGLPFCEQMDMWSFGCVIVELHLGWPLYPGSNEYDQIRYIVETQGLPKIKQLSSGIKTHLFFKQNLHLKWELKSKEEYSEETTQQSSESRIFTLSSLDQLERTNIESFPSAEVKAELHDQKMMVDLIKKILNLDPSERIRANIALKHAFITMQKLKLQYKNTAYYGISIQSLKDACLFGNKKDMDAACCHTEPCHKEEQYQRAEIPYNLTNTSVQISDKMAGSSSNENNKEEKTRRYSFSTSEKNKGKIADIKEWLIKQTKKMQKTMGKVSQEQINQLVSSESVAKGHGLSQGAEHPTKRCTSESGRFQHNTEDGSYLDATGKPFNRHCVETEDKGMNTGINNKNKLENEGNASDAKSKV
ncbi:homeodomain-interacting protein kinase 4-like [Callorhinchus milii]|uniref:homeodomain-interacting protein kinase 4-like n=1 Tax=Callorhinchus milii TaxID=7868 RepID=UPI0004571F79|nr:homeodomain-interacting protein kinase 4-like [Callorhinchus milii]|eukprot:gi/632982313/ref/XP_007908069.1/ PREDICTED: homeodomain-interacting protein kinase 4-like [Callorhinchus milii]